MQLVVYAGAVWGHCSPTEVERLTVSSREEAIERLAEWLDWLPRERAEQVAREAISSDDCVLAGYSNDLRGLLPEPPEGAEVYDVNRFGDTVYLVPGGPDSDLTADIPGTAWEPFYVCASIIDGEA